MTVLLSFIEKQITLYEEDARKMYRKWDNVKHISEKIKETLKYNHAPKKELLLIRKVFNQS